MGRLPRISAGGVVLAIGLAAWLGGLSAGAMAEAATHAHHLSFRTHGTHQKDRHARRTPSPKLRSPLSVVVQRTDPPLATVPKAVFDKMRVVLSPALGPAGITATQAASGAMPGRILETVLAHCSFSPLPPGVSFPPLPDGTIPKVFTIDQDCWVLSQEPLGPPSGGEPHPFGQSPGFGPLTYIGVAYRVTLVDATTGKFLMGFERGA